MIKGEYVVLPTKDVTEETILHSLFITFSQISNKTLPGIWYAFLKRNKANTKVRVQIVISEGIRVVTKVPCG